MQILPSSNPIQGNFKVPGDKSISHRALIVASILGRPIQIENLNTGEDIQKTSEALQSWGVEVSSSSSRSLIVHKRKAWQKHEDTIDLGNSGTSARLLMGLASSMPWNTMFSGDISLNKRPMNRVVEPLTQMGAEFFFQSSLENNFLPIKIKGTSDQLNGITYNMPVASAQVKSSLLIAGLFAKGKTIVREKQRTRDHTERMFGYFNLPIEYLPDGGIKVYGNCFFEINKNQSSLIIIANDPSAAAFLITAALIIPDSYIQIHGVCINPLRSKYIEILKNMGGKIELYNLRNQCGEEVADITASYSPLLNAIDISEDLASSLIDEYPILSVAAAHAYGTSTFKGLSELRIKESDRLKSIHNFLKTFGVQANIDENLNSLTIQGKTYNTKIENIILDCGLDHRIAMATAVMGSLHEKPFIIKNSDSVNTSFPGFFDIFSRI